MCFKQKKNELNPRGYEQKSFIVLTRLPFLTFFEKMVDFLVCRLFSRTDLEVRTGLESITTQIENWPLPEPLTSYILPILDYQITIEVPNYMSNGHNNNHHRDIIKEQLSPSKPRSASHEAYHQNRYANSLTPPLSPSQGISL